MKYVDGFVLVVPKNKVNAYKKMAEQAAKAWKRHGALEYFECMGDDLNPKGMDGTYKGIKFPQTVKAKPNEVVFFSFIIYKSKADRNKVNAKVMKEFTEMDQKEMEMPFDMKRMAYGGFKAIVEK